MIATEDAPFRLAGAGCPECGSPVMAARNPFYGVDLAVNKYIRNCVDCAWYNFASDSSSSGPAREPAPQRGRSLREFLTRLNAAVSILTAP